jgi:hypothetical protein
MINTIYIHINPPGIDLHTNSELLLDTMARKIRCLGYMETPLYIKYHGEHCIYRQ